MSRTTLSIQDYTKDEFDDLKPENVSQDEFLQVLLDHYNTVPENDTEPPADVATSEDIDALRKSLSRLEEQVERVPQNTAEHLR